MNKKPNVLIIFTDQQRHDTINYAVYPHMITPNLDRLASQGCTYINAYSTNPVCMPARHDLITGLPARAHGYFTNAKKPIRDYGLPTLPRIFLENGYRTAAIGKMHFFPQSMHHGFGEMYLMEELPRCRQDDQYACYLNDQGLGHIQNIHGIRPHVYHIPQNSQMDEAHHGSTWVANKTIDWLKTNGDNPFFVITGFIHPHPPWDLPKEYQGIYMNKDLPRPVPVSRRYPDVSRESQWFGDNDTDEQKRRIREAYYSAVTMVDKNIGRILDYMEQSGMMEDTLIIFTSDHGEMLQDKGYYSKEVPYEGSVRIPFIIRYPQRFKQGVIKEEFVDLFDVMPTCLDVCGLEYNGDKFELPGESLCASNPKRDRTHQISSYGTGERRWVLNRNERYKYIYIYNQGREELYDLENDPGETINLIEEGNYPRDVYEELKRGAIEYEKQWGPEGVIEDDMFIVIDGTQYHPCVRGKFHLWANNQFQTFDERSNAERGRQFMQEIQYALANYDNSGVRLNEVFNDPEWKESFMENWRKYGEGEDIFKLLFK